MRFLASDLLEGREAGTRGYDIAAAYVASAFAQMGLTPAGGDGSYLQPVRLAAFRPAGPGRMSLDGVALTPGVDFLAAPNPVSPETVVEAPLVFAGYGLVDAGHGRDDYAGLDVAGKIVVLLSGAPPGLDTEERAYLGSERVKRRAAAARGAVGYIVIPTRGSEQRRPFARRAEHAGEWSMSWRRPDGEVFVFTPEAPRLAELSPKAATQLFAGAAATLEEIWTLAEAPGGNPPRFDLAKTARVEAKTEFRDTESANVAGLIEGADPRRRDEVVVLSAHLDHVGLADSGADRINNGALDNAAGVASLLEAARSFAEGGARPDRSVLFLMVTAEEKGLLGAEFFARHPTDAVGEMVANVNLDMPVVLYDFTDVVAFGAERSTLGPMVRAAANRSGVALSPDPMPDEGLFTRSDHFRFVEQGVPSVFLMTGFANGGEAAFRAFLAERYHRPGDDLAQPIDYAAAARFAQINFEIAREIADAPDRPAWNAGDFFGERFGGKARD